jgi:hypothetical protein
MNECGMAFPATSFNMVGLSNRQHANAVAVVSNQHERKSKLLSLFRGEAADHGLFVGLAGAEDAGGKVGVVDGVGEVFCF